MEIEPQNNIEKNLHQIEKELQNDIKSVKDKLHFLKQYYTSHFPFEQIFKWLSVFHSPSEMVRREISYIISSPENPEDEFCVRNIGYNNYKNFKKDVTQMVPLRIDIGAFFDGDVASNKNKVKDLIINPIEREFVIDIDMTDYDHIRTCCKGKKLCKLCWTFIKAAYKVLEKILNDSFDFKHILWVYSGRRGLHAWVCDKDAKLMSKKVRHSVTEFLNLTINNDKVNYLVKKELIDRTEEYPILLDAYNILVDFKGFLINEQKILDVRNIWEKSCDVVTRYTDIVIPHEERSRVFLFKDQNRKFNFLISEFEKIVVTEEKNWPKELRLRKFKIEFILGYLYPKIDSHVSAQVNHLLKSPFNIHHATMNVSLPIINMEEFDIDSCYKVNDLLSEMIRDKVNNPFTKSLRFFEKFVKKLEKSER